MDTHNIKHWLLVGVSCLMLAPAGALAEDYLKGKTSYRPLEEDAAERQAEAFPEDYRLGGGVLTDEIREKRKRVEARVKEQMDALMSGEGQDSHESENVTTDELNALVAKAQAGDAEAIGQVGYVYEKGLGITRNEEKALEWYQRALDYDETEYYSAIGMMYRDYGAQEGGGGFLAGLRGTITGDGSANDLPDDDRKAREWFEKGVKAYDWNSFLKLSEMYRDGAGGLTPDIKQASWLYTEGLRLLEKHDRMELQKIEQEFRIEAEVEEGMRASETAPIGGVQ